MDFAEFILCVCAGGAKKNENFFLEIFLKF